jgi:hypothetical protein
MRRLLVWALVAFFGLLVVQLSQRWRDRLPLEAPEPIVLRSGTPASRVAGGALKRVGQGACRPVYFLDPLCPACSTLAERWKGEGRPTGVWVISRERETAAAFVEEHSIPLTEVLFLADVEGIVPDLAAVGVHAAPTSAILDACGAFQHVRGGPLPVSEETLERYCNQECSS